MLIGRLIFDFNVVIFLIDALSLSSPPSISLIYLIDNWFIFAAEYIRIYIFQLLWTLLVIYATILLDLESIEPFNF